MFYTILTMIAKTRLIFLTVIVASLTLGLAAAITANAFMTQSASAQSTGGTPTYSPPGGNASSGNSTSGNPTK